MGAGTQTAAGSLQIYVNGSAAHGPKCTSDGPERATCADLHGALALASSSAQLSKAVMVHLVGVHTSGPYKVNAPDTSKIGGTLKLLGAAGATATSLDGGGTGTLLEITGGNGLTVTGISFSRGWVNATTGKGKAPVRVTAKSVVFADCSFVGNRGFDGGAVLLDGGEHTFRRCQFTDNQGYGGGDGGAHDTGGGGAIFMVYTHLHLIDTLFLDNVATDPPGTAHTKGHPGHPPKGKAGLGHTGTHHGGAVMSVQGHIIARNSTFARGNAYQGGALYTWMWGLIDVQGCHFINNTAIGATHNTGGAIFSDRGSAVIRDSVFQGNIANASGGAIFAWSAHGSCKNLTAAPAMRTQRDSSLQPHTGSSVSTRSSGAPCVPGVPCVCQNISISGCEFIGNIARGHSGGGAIANQWSTFLVSGSTCTDNHPNAIWTDGGSTTNMSASSSCGHHRQTAASHTQW